MKNRIVFAAVIIIGTLSSFASAQSPQAASAVASKPSADSPFALSDEQTRDKLRKSYDAVLAAQASKNPDAISRADMDCAMCIIECYRSLEKRDEALQKHSEMLNQSLGQQLTIAEMATTLEQAKEKIAECYSLRIKMHENADTRAFLRNERKKLFGAYMAAMLAKAFADIKIAEQGPNIIGP